jgi:hypothetical protein
MTKLVPFLALCKHPDGTMLCMAATDEFPEPGVWGVILGDVVQHLVNAYEDSGKNREQVREILLRVLDAELAHPSDKAVRVPGTWTDEGFVPHGAGEGEA